MVCLKTSMSFERRASFNARLILFALALLAVAWIGDLLGMWTVPW